MQNLLKSMFNIKNTIITLLSFPLLFLIYYQIQVRFSQERAEVLLAKIEHSLFENQELLKFIGERVVASENITLEYINSLLKGTNVLALSHLMGSYISWADKSGRVLVSGKKGILEVDRPSISHRKYYKEGLKEPWKLHSSPVEQSVFSTNYVLPTSISVADKNGEVIGFLVLGLRLKFLEHTIERELKGLEWRLAYFDNDSIFGSVGFPKNFAWANSSYTNGGSFIVKSGGQFPIKVAVGLTMIEMVVRFLKLYCVFIASYYVIVYLIISYVSPLIKRYALKENANLLVNLELALLSDDRIGALKALLLNADGNAKNIIESLILMFEREVELGNKLAALGVVQGEFSAAARAQSKYLVKVGQIAQANLDQLKIEIGNLYEKSSREDRPLVSKLISNIEQIATGDFSKNERSYCKIVDYIDEAIAMNAYNIHTKELIIERSFDDHPECYTDPCRLESAIISITRYCVDSALKGKVLKIQTRNILSDNNSKIQITFEVSMVAMNVLERLALERLLDISAQSNIFDPLNKTYEQIERSFKLLGARVEASDDGGRGLKITISLDLSASNQEYEDIIPGQDNVVAFKKVKYSSLT